MNILEASILHHLVIVLVLLWLLSSFNCCHPIAYFISLIYLHAVHERYVTKLRRKLQFEERKQSNQRRVLRDSESVRWLNYAVEKIWPICMEQIVSQKILQPIVPWFLQKYKPWTAKEAVIQHLYLGRCPPLFTEMRVLRQSTDDDHLVMELGMNFLTADDMSAILAVKLRKRLGFGMWAKLHLTGMHIEGKVLVGIKFLPRWPFIGRLRVCFVEAPYFQMTVKPISTHGLDVAELPGIAGWLDHLLSLAFEQTLVEPNMLVVDMEKFASSQQENWFSVEAKDPIAHAIVEVIEGADMNPSDLNGLADPYVKGQFGPYRFRTKIQKKTLAPKWHEEFKIPICTWESPNVLTIEVCDKDRFVDDTMGDCSINVNDLRDGQRHDMWFSLQNIKMGRLHLAVTVVDGNGKGKENVAQHEDDVNNEDKRNSFATDAALKVTLSSEILEKSLKVADKFEPIDIEGQRETGIWVHSPGNEVAQVWEPRKGKSRLHDNQIHVEGADSLGSFKSSASGCQQDDSSSTDENLDGNKGHEKNRFRRGLHKISSVFHRSPNKDEKCSSMEEALHSPNPNLKAVNEKETGVKLIVDDSLPAPSPFEGRESPEGSQDKGNAKDKAKNIFKHAGNSARKLKHAWSRKGSGKLKGESGTVIAERDISVTSDSSDRESIPSGHASSVGNDSFKSKENLIMTTPNDPAINIVDSVNKGNDSFISKENLIEPTLNDHAVNLVDPVTEVDHEGNVDGPIESSNSKALEGILLVEK